MDGIALVNSGAGSGKTSVFTARIANLILNKSISPTRILGLTFTNEAATSMKNKLATKIGDDKAKMVNLSTFHSFAYRTMKSNFPELYKGKQIVQQWWKIQTASEVVSFTDGFGLNMKPGEFLGFVSYQKANLVRANMDVVVDSQVPYAKGEDVNKLKRAYERFLELCEHARVYDFDDMLLDFFYKLDETEWLVEKMKSQYTYIMVDEFQDTSMVNLEILKKISDNNLFVVGDFRQGIYSFINADIDNILTFASVFPNTKLIELRENFRSTTNIVKISNDVIDASPNEKYKGFSSQLAGRLDDGERIKITGFNMLDDEIQYICDSIEKKHENTHLNYADFAIICRTNAELGFFESEMADKGIPVRLSSNKSFFDRSEIADVLAYATHAADEWDDMSLRRIYNTPNRFIAKKTMTGLTEYAYKNKVSLEEALERGDVGRSGYAFDNLLDIFAFLRKHLDKPADKFLKIIIDKVKYEDHINNKSATANDLVIRKEALDKLLKMASRFTSIRSFLAHVDIIKSNSKKDEDAVNVMTTHASKGLEFDTVYVSNVNELSYPHVMSTDPEEERRLLYVALSRAVNTLEVTYVQMSEKDVINPSPFLVDIAPIQVEVVKKNIMGGKAYSDFYY